MQNLESHAISIISIMLIGVLILSPVISSTQDPEPWTRGTKGIVATPAKSGSVEDIQAAVDEAEANGGGIVLVPAGNFTFDATASKRVEIPGGVSVFGAGKNETILDLPEYEPSLKTRMFYVHGENGKRTRISGITFIGRTDPDSRTGDTGVEFHDCKDFRVDNCRFVGLGSDGVAVRNYYYPDLPSQGVVDHNEFIDIYKPWTYANWTGFGYGVAIIESYNIPDCPWEPDVDNLQGKYENNVFIEDNYFTGCRHTVCGYAGAVYVFRYNVLRNNAHDGSFHMVDAHPARDNCYGNRWFEVYNNILEETSPPNDPVTGDVVHRTRGCNMEGGGGVIFNNTFWNLVTVICFQTCETDDPELEKCHLKDVWIWDNTFTIGSGEGDCWGFLAKDGYGSIPAPVEGEDYFLYTKPSYQPYPYPHPLTLENTT